MKLHFDTSLAESYSSVSQKIRVMSEAWVADNGYCVYCGSCLVHFENNKPVGDFYCSSCKAEFELKCHREKLNERIQGGAYDAMINKIESGTVPNLLCIAYDAKEYSVKDFVAIPGYFFSKTLVLKRKPLKETARRAGWTGCILDISSIPSDGKVYIIKDKAVIDKNSVIGSFMKTLFVRSMDENTKGWTCNILKCIEFIGKNIFSLDDIYGFEQLLQSRHPRNSAIRAKIRQQLQILRDKNYLVFLGNGMYRLR